MEMRGLFVGGVLCFQRLGVVLLGCQGMAVGFLFFCGFCFFVSRVQDRESWGAVVGFFMGGLLDIHLCC